MPSTNLERYIPLLIDLLISNNFSSSYDIFFAQRVFYELSVVKLYDSQPIFCHNKKKVK